MIINCYLIYGYVPSMIKNLKLIQKSEYTLYVQNKWLFLKILESTTHGRIEKQ